MDYVIGVDAGGTKTEAIAYSLSGEELGNAVCGFGNLLCGKNEGIKNILDSIDECMKGLNYNHFIKCSKQFKDLGVRTAAFVNSQKAQFGPWPVSEGLCTLEQHRNLPIEVQAKHLFAAGAIDDVIIANAFASEEELRALSAINKNMLELKVKLSENISDIEKKIVLEELHFNRGDVSDYLVRSTQSRVKYKGQNFEPFNIVDIKRGDVLIESSLYKRYVGELQIALKDMKIQEKQM